jgi:hypothetical protein
MFLVRLLLSECLTFFAYILYLYVEYPSDTAFLYIPFFYYLIPFTSGLFLALVWQVVVMARRSPK